jgi:hypothetical protein
MRTGTCPKCGGSDIYISRNDPVLMKIGLLYPDQKTDHYLCGDCGYYESYVVDLDKLRQALAKSPLWKKVG